MTDVVVVGGGLAGITAALDAADAGLSVTLLERRGWLGGATYSFERNGLVVDNGQHVFLRCCTAYRELLRRLGVEQLTTLQPRLDVPVHAPGRRTWRLRRSNLPSPWHLAGALAGYRALSVADRFRAVRAALAMQRLSSADHRVDAEAFGTWLRAHGQRARAIDRLWELATVATLNARADEASLALAAMVVQTGLLATAGGADIGYSNVPLGQLHGAAALRALREAAVDVHLQTTVRTLDDISARAVILAVPPRAAQQLLPPAAINHELPLESSPIVNLHFEFNDVVMSEPFIAAVDSPVQWVFDRTSSAGCAAGQYLVVSLSAAAEWIDVPTKKLCATFSAALADVLPEVRRAELRNFFVTREPAATFRQSPGTAGLRPPARTSVPGLYVAGAWTDTGWPATMEGAVRSGHSAAAVAIADRATTSVLVAS